MAVQVPTACQSTSGLCRILLSVLAIGFTANAHAQQRGSFLRAGAENKAQHLLGPTGKPCVAIKTNTRVDPIVTTSYQHLVEAQNTCNRPVIVKICYKGSSLGCRDLRLRPNAPGETTMLGVMSGMPRFEIEYSDRFPL